MTAPIASYIQLPTGNTGKKAQEQYETIGSNVVYVPNIILRQRKKVLGIYNFSQGVANTVGAGAQTGVTGTAGAGTGLLYLMINPTVNGVIGRLRRLEIQWSVAGSTTAQTTAPRILLRRYVATGTLNANLITSCKRATTDSTASALAATTSGTLLGGLNEIVWATLAPPYGYAAGLTTGWMKGAVDIWNPSSEDEYVEFDTVRGLVVYQADAGTTDVRKLVICGIWDECDVT